MATVKVSALSALPDASVTASDVVPVVDDIGGTPTTYRLSLGQLRTAVLTAPNAGGWATSDYLAAGAGTVPTTGVIRVGQGTLTTASAPLINSTATWNDAAVTFTHQLINVTDTASNAASLLADWQVGGSSKWKVTKGGAVTQAGALTISSGGLTVTGNSTITGTLGGLTGLTVGGSGITVSAGGIAVNAGTTAVQALTATTVTASSNITAGASSGFFFNGRSRLVSNADGEMSVQSNAGAAANMIVAGLTASSGITVSAGTTAVQALTATTGTFSGDLNVTGAHVLVSGGPNPYLRLDDGTGQAFVQVVSGDLNLTPRAGKAVSISSALTVGAVTSGAITATGNSTITGTLSGITTLTATSLVGALTGNASTATALQTARTINGTAFDGTANITVTAAAGTLTGATLNSSVTASSLTSVGVLASPHMTSPVVDSGGLTVTAGNVNASSSRVMSGNLEVWNTWDGANTAGVLKLTSDTAATATAGAAALPAAPVGFLKWRIGSTAVLLPYYNL